MPRFRLAGLGVVLLVSLAAPAAAQRSLHWRSMEVRANLDAEGRLAVSERLAYVFTGDWNGGERVFDIRRSQRLELTGLYRLDLAAGVAVPLVRGDLDQVDHYDWADRNTLRWRSRAPFDPPFDETEIVYVIDYVLDGVLLDTGDGYRLDHDFAIPNRQDLIGRFTLDFTLDPAWQPETALPEHWEATGLVPGESFVVGATLAYGGTGSPRTWRTLAPPWLGWTLAGGLLATLLGGSALFWRRERTRGRFAPLPRAVEIDEAWLAEHVFRHRPEVVGAAWDNVTGASEVAALLARLVQEGKLSSRVEKRGRGWLATEVLHLQRLVPLDAFEGYERQLVAALFVSGERTDTEKIRAHYKSRGFDPASKIKAGVTRRVDDLLGGRAEPARRRLGRAGCLVLLAGVALLGFAAWRDAADAPLVIGGLIAGALLSTLGAGLAAGSRQAVVHPVAAAIPFHVPLLALVAGAVWLVLHQPQLVGTPALVGLAGVAATLAAGILHAARSVESPERIALRKRLAGARAFFREQLARTQPDLRDEWYPYLLAFGLGSRIDRWFKAFGEAGSGAAASTAAALGGGSGSGGSSSTWTGGGGAFGGAGASAAWATAAGGLAAGVSPPGSSGGGGSSSGGGGGGSSGGGGAGGW